MYRNMNVHCRVRNVFLDKERDGMLVLEKIIFRRILHVKCYCNGENGKVNIARVILVFALEVCPFVDSISCQRFRLTIA